MVSPAANRDLIRLWRWIAAPGFPDNATAFTDNVLSFCFSLSRFPHRGISHAKVRAGLRSVGYHKQVRIVFSVSENEKRVDILRILHARQSLEQVLHRIER